MPNNNPMPVNDKIKGWQSPSNSRKKKYSDNTIKQMASIKEKKILYFIAGPYLLSVDTNILLAL